MIQGSNKISLYEDSLTKENLAKQTARILKIFPKFPSAMLEELKEAFIKNKFTDKRIQDAVDYVRDNYEGWDKLPNIANFIKFDNNIDLFTYPQVLEKVQNGESMNNYKQYEKDKRYWYYDIQHI